MRYDIYDGDKYQVLFNVPNVCHIEQDLINESRKLTDRFKNHNLHGGSNKR